MLSAAPAFAERRPNLIYKQGKGHRLCLALGEMSTVSLSSTASKKEALSLSFVFSQSDQAMSGLVDVC